MSSRNVYDFSYEQKAVVWLLAVNSLLFDRNQCCFLLNKSKDEMNFTSLPRLAGWLDIQYAIRTAFCRTQLTLVTV